MEDLNELARTLKDLVSLSYRNTSSLTEEEEEKLDKQIRQEAREAIEKYLKGQVQ